MNITAWRRGTAIVFELHGNLGAGVDRPGTLAAVVTAATASHVILDLEDVRRLDCAGIGELIRLRRALDLRGSTLTLVHVAPCQHRMLEMARLQRFLTVCSSLEEALPCQPRPRRRPSGHLSVVV